MKTHILAALMAAGLSAAGFGSAFAESAPLVAGTVTKLDASAGKIAIDHQKIPNLDMDPMTMVFKAADPAMLKAVKVGQKIRFSADRVNGQLTVTRIEKAK
ncbi:MAG: copper-binding protein [Rhodoblastus sp.]